MKVAEVGTKPRASAPRSLAPSAGKQPTDYGWVYGSLGCLAMLASTALVVAGLYAGLAWIIGRNTGW